MCELSNQTPPHKIYTRHQGKWAWLNMIPCLHKSAEKQENSNALSDNAYQRMYDHEPLPHSHNNKKESTKYKVITRK